MLCGPKTQSPGSPSSRQLRPNDLRRRAYKTRQSTSETISQEKAGPAQCGGSRPMALTRQHSHQHFQSKKPPTTTKPLILPLLLQGQPLNRISVALFNHSFPLTLKDSPSNTPPEPASRYSFCVRYQGSDLWWLAERE
jgi:hypothetical protein